MPHCFNTANLAFMHAIEDRCFQIDCTIFTPNPGRLAHIGEMVKKNQADGVIQYGLQFCQPFLMEAVVRALKETCVPVLQIDTDNRMEDTGRIKARAEAFVGMHR
ncbi:MAG TPA: 2-hydroxyacyl-CoA dehydratase family protein [Deltaproteobacteria bacterium]|nr:2-hydroxyacyl-CoA dehydratase family protein [Deltaproteobacteria bacterium]HQM21319.1 2-hydroxyacyl-CoA dehydratase family protein [Deltaproteobacteria bacterium]